MIKFIDLFAGIGGFHLAMKKFDSKCVFASEWDKECQEVYKNNFNLKPYGDITKLDEKLIPKHDLLFAGFPCQAFSISGKQQGFKDTRGTLFFDVARIAKYHKTKILFLENVKNFISHDNGNTIKVVKNTLEEIGYNVFFKVLNASNFGVPQKRERIYIIAIKKELGINHFDFPNSYKKSSKLKDVLESNINDKKIILKNKYKPKIKTESKQASLFEENPMKPIRIGYVNKGGQGERIYSILGHAISLTAYGGGIGSKTGLYMVGKNIRKLTPRECARISGFPDNFKLHEKTHSNYKMFGNTVVVNVVESILNILLPICFNLKTKDYSKQIKKIMFANEANARKANCG